MANDPLVFNLGIAWVPQFWQSIEVEGRLNILTMATTMATIMPKPRTAGRYCAIICYLPFFLLGAYWVQKSLI